MEDVEKAWAHVLGAVYKSVDWRRMKGRNPLDVFEHRVRFASYEPTVSRVLDKLMNTLGLQAPRALLAVFDDLQYLRENEGRALAFLRENIKLLVYEAYLWAKSQRGKRNGDGKAEEDDA